MFPMDDALEEGRAALHLLEKQLKERNPQSDVSVGSKSQQNSLTHERRILDKVPRDTRLHYRQESPLGLTVEELDDRGLLDGGGSIPSYYTSSRQKNRRPLEMRSRTSRLLERDQESTAKLLNSLFHMIRALTKRGLNIEEYCRARDPEGRGLINKKLFYSVLRQMGLPFSRRDLAEISQRYSVPDTDDADYEALLRDAGILNEEGDGENQSMAVDIGMYAGVLMDVKRMLLDSMRSLNKTPDDVFRMFAQWDHEGIGTVTATQFLRVLARLHIYLSDNDQDFLIELLDTNAMGRIDFESLLNFCFGDLPSNAPLASPSATISTQADDRSAHAAAAAETPLTEADGSSLGSHSARGGGQRRPHTAASYRPTTAGYIQDTIGPVNYGSNPATKIRNAVPFTGDTSLSPSGGTLPPLLVPGGRSTSMQGPVEQPQISILKTQRPITAAPRVSGNFEGGRNPVRYIDNGGKQQYGNEFPEDIIINDDEENYLGNNEGQGEMVVTAENLKKNENSNSQFYSMNFTGYNAGGGNGAEYAHPDGIDLQDVGSLNDTTLITEQGEYNLGSPMGLLPIGIGAGIGFSATANNISNIFPTGEDGNAEVNFRSDWPGNRQYAAPIQNEKFRSNNEDSSGGRPVALVPPPLERHGSKDKLLVERTKGEANGSGGVVEPPLNHLNELARQTVVAVRDMLLNRMKYGTKLRALYQHFDRRGKMFIDANDFISVTAEMRIDISVRVAELAISLLAIDGVTEVSFGEFKVFLLDPDHKALERMFLAQVSQQLERQGRKFQSWLHNIFWEKEIASRIASGSNAMTSSRDLKAAQAQLAQSGMVRSQTFRETLAMMGTKLTANDIDRFVDRFDIYGQGQCSVARFLHFVQESSEWRGSERILSYQEEAVEEAAILREQIRRDGSSTIPGLTEELLSMAEYLGIRAITEQHLLWIAADALRAPLPVSWSAQKDSQGRTFFYNHISNQSRWDHPLDPHFRKLRDDYRKSDQQDNARAKDPPGTYKYGAIVADRSSSPLNALGKAPNLPPMGVGSSRSQQQSQQQQFQVSQPSDERIEDYPEGDEAYTGPNPKPVGKSHLRPQSAMSVLPGQSSDHQKQKFTTRNPVDSELKNIYAAQYAEHLKSAGNLKVQLLHRPTSAPNIANEANLHSDGQALLDAYRPLVLNNTTQSTEAKKKTLEDIYKGNPGTKKVPKGSISGSTHQGSQFSSGIGIQRLNSAGRTRPLNNNAGTVIEKALNSNREPGYLMQVGSKSGSKDKSRSDYSSVPPTREEMTRTAQLADMFDDGIIGKLDCIIVPRTNSNSELNNNAGGLNNKPAKSGAAAPQPSLGKKKGGIVLM